MKIVSACFLGINCKYNGGNNLDLRVVELGKKEILVPVCPEQLGGLSTPREPCEQREKGVFARSGKDLTKEFERGAEEVLKIAQLLGCKEAILKQKEAILKQRSPSCGCGQIPEGTFSKKIIKDDGITTVLLKKNGIKVMSEEDI